MQVVNVGTISDNAIDKLAQGIADRLGPVLARELAATLAATPIQTTVIIEAQELTASVPDVAQPVDDVPDVVPVPELVEAPGVAARLTTWLGETYRGEY